MPFVGVASIHPLGKHLVRITGLSLAGNTTGTIGLFGDAGADVQLPASFPSQVDPGAALMGYDLTDVVEFRFHDNSTGGGPASAHYHQVEQVAPFRCIVTNDAGVATPGFDIFIQFHHTLTR